MTQITLNVPDISCNHCKMSIEGAVNELGGVDAANVDVAARTVDVSYDTDSMNRDAIVTAIEEQGYEVAG
jgi:copper chaperone